MMYRIKILFPGLGLTTAAFERIKGSVARADDTCDRLGCNVVIMTRFPSEFITSFYDDGFGDTLEVEQVSE